MTTIEIARDDLAAIAPLLPAGIVYDGGHLEVADADAAAVQALVADMAAHRAAALKNTLLAHAAAKRFAVETGGITVNGESIDTSRDSQAMITGAYAWSQANPAETIKFKAVSGFVELDATQMAAIATAVGAHVQACFAKEADIAAQIAAGAITTTVQIDAADWPG